MTEPTPTTGSSTPLAKQAPAVIETAGDAPTPTPGYNWENWAFACTAVFILSISAILASALFQENIDQLVNEHLRISYLILMVATCGVGLTAFFMMVVFYMLHNKARLIFLLPAMVPPFLTVVLVTIACTGQYYHMYPPR